MAKKDFLLDYRQTTILDAALAHAKSFSFYVDGCCCAAQIREQTVMHNSSNQDQLGIGNATTTIARQTRLAILP